MYTFELFEFSRDLTANLNLEPHNFQDPKTNEEVPKYQFQRENSNQRRLN